MSQDPFDLLGVEETAGDEDVRRAWFARVKVVRPERDPEGFRALRAAYDALRTPEGRAWAALDRWPSAEQAAAPGVDRAQVLLAFASYLADPWSDMPEEPW